MNSTIFFGDIVEAGDDTSIFDAALADCLLSAANCFDPWLRTTMTTVSAAVQQGHACVPLQRVLAQLADISLAPRTNEDLYKAMLATPLVGVCGALTPLICDGQRLYLRRYFEYEREVANAFLERARAVTPISINDTLQQQLDALFPIRDAAPNSQRSAAILALRSRLTVICGGPGTGKTWTVLRLLVLLLQQSTVPLRIALAAPTGKAAARLSESLNRDLGGLPIAESLRKQIPQSAITLHRLLGLRPDSTRARHHAESPLAIDILVLDEASMVDLPNMARLLAALPESARLIVLGDPDQLAAVETGSVLAELRAGNPENSYSTLVARDLKACGCDSVVERSTTNLAVDIADHVITLTTSHRYTPHSDIDSLLQAVKKGDAEHTLRLLETGAGLQRIEAVFDTNTFARRVVELVEPYYEAVSQAVDVRQALNALARFRVLSVLRDGPRGVRALNALLARARLNLPAWQPVPDKFSGAPVLITANDPGLELYNGDSGVMWKDEQLRLCGWFISPAGELRSYLPAQLPEHEWCYAMTAHKAQGSEFEHVLIVLPNAPHPLLSREWLYTACSRARSQLTVMGSVAVLRAALDNRTVRWSGLSSWWSGEVNKIDRGGREVRSTS